MTGSADVTTSVERFAALAVRHGLSLGVMHSGAAGDFALTVAAASQAFAHSVVYRECEVNERLLAWLGDTGQMLATDHVELRRWLVDAGILIRDAFGRAYSLGAPASSIGALMTALRTTDLAAIARVGREHHAAEREARKSRWTQRGTAPDA